MNVDEYHLVILVGLLHDIGKLVRSQRESIQSDKPYGHATGRYAHARDGVNFLKFLGMPARLGPSVWSLLADLVENHHTMLWQRGNEALGWLISKSDQFSAKERIEDENGSTSDIDGCIEEDQLLSRAESVVRDLQSYTEISPSGLGLRILVACPEFLENVRLPELEVYAHSRFLTVTGNHVQGTPKGISTVTSEQIAALMPKPREEKRFSRQYAAELVAPDVGNLELWAHVFDHDRFGADHRRRFQGDTSLDGDDHSLTVIRLLNCLTRWTGRDAVRMRAMMLASPLANAKWFSKRSDGDWLDYQIADAINYVLYRG